MTRLRRATLLSAALVVLPHAAHAAPALEGAKLAWFWALPFAGILATIAIGPLLFPKLWHHHYGKFALAWSALTLAPLALAHGLGAALGAFVHAALAEYMSFIVLLFALYVVAGGILVRGNLRGTPLTNVALIGFGTVIASLVGTTGAAMILIRPLIRANAGRRHSAHVVIFFIFLAANIGGALSPLGDPPLFVGFLRGVDFFWTLKHLWLPTLASAGLLLAVFFVLDAALVRREPVAAAAPARLALRIHGAINLGLIGAIIAIILAAAAGRTGVVVDILGTPMTLESLLRDGALVAVALVSLVLTPDEHRAANDFSFEPIREVAILFAGIFTCIIPVLAMLQAGHDGAFAGLLGAVTTPDGRPHTVAYFWLTGILSGFLDNAPTYLVFFELAGGNAPQLMTTHAPTLAAISMGAVYMGALTYIGNAPNFMVYAIAVSQGVRMPSFFGYLLWSAVILLPVFGLVSLLFVGR